jgi:amino acid adenylation domain-containing protein
LDSLTPSRLERIQARLEEAGLRTAGEGIPRREERGVAPLSFAQERLWFFGRMAPDSAVFHIPVAYRVEGPLEVERLERALADVHARHASLRTSFELDPGGTALQRVAATVAPVLEVVDLTGHEDGAAEALERARADSRRPFDLETAPLLRTTLYRLGAEEHLLLLTFHHIVSEVQSLGILMRDLTRSYAGEGDALPELPVQFGDFAAWQRERVEGETLDSMLAWWRERLAGELPPLQLPTDHPRPAVQTFSGGTRTRTLPRELADGLRALCRAEGVTPFAATLAVWSALLARLSGQEEVLVGVPMTDRTRAEVQDLVGFFVNTLVLRTDLSGAPTFRELLARVHDAHLGALSHQDLPFERLVEELDTERDLSRNPLFQVAFLYQTAEEAGEAAHAFGPRTHARVLEDPLAVHTDTSKFDASLVVWDGGDGLAASVEYSTDLFEPVTIDRMLERFERLLTGVVADPDRALSTLPIVTAEEETLLAAWNDTAAELREDVCVDQLFEEQVDRAPDALAVAFEGRELSYRELEERANRLAHHLRELGVGPDRPVAIATGRTPEMVVAILGTLKAGGAYLPLDLDYPAERIAFLLRDADVAAVLTAHAVADGLPDFARRVELDTDWPAIEARPATRPERVSGPANLAYVIYTSGSTGTPKGVALEHTGLVNLLSWHRRTYDVRPEDRATHLAGLAFDASVWELWPYLTAGSSLHLVPDEVRLAPRRLVAWMGEHRITQSFVPTPLCEAMLREELPHDLPLAEVFTGGDKLHRAPDRELPFRLVNHYGPTENTVVATAVPVPPAPDDDTPPPIGHPIDNVQVFVLDRGGQLAPIGVPGELFIAGKSLARGYFGRPDLTGERFVTSPLDGETRLYATGDLVRWREDGEIEFLGRLDGQVKVRGFRIELGEIEAQLGGHAGVAECAVVVRTGAGGGGTGGAEAALVGYAVPANGTPPRPEDLRAHLREQLPEYMVPSAIVLLDAMPLTPNGKIDLRALPEPERTDAETEFVLPEGELEERIAAIWGELLELDRIGSTANFFDLGGHSLLLAQVHVRLQEAVDPALSIVELFRHPTVSSLATHLAGRADEDAGVEKSRDRGARRRAALQGRARGRRRS